jgi:hypothetical protein
MPKKPNYSFEKRQKDLARQKKKEEKLQAKVQKRDARGRDLPGDGEASGPEAAIEPAED